MDRARFGTRAPRRVMAITAIAAALLIPSTVVAVTKTGTDGPDRLVGTSEGDTLEGRGGRDTILGLGGNDTLYGNLGRDTLRGGAGDDLLIGYTGLASFRDPEGDIDRLFGDAGHDTADCDLDDVVNDAEVIRRESDIIPWPEPEPNPDA